MKSQGKGLSQAKDRKFLMVKEQRYWLNTRFTFALPNFQFGNAVLLALCWYHVLKGSRDYDISHDFQ